MLMRTLAFVGVMAGVIVAGVSLCALADWVAFRTARRIMRKERERDDA